MGHKIIIIILFIGMFWVTITSTIHTIKLLFKKEMVNGSLMIMATICWYSFLWVFYNKMLEVLFA